MNGQAQSEIPLPGYLSRQHSGIFVDLSLFPVAGGFAEFVDQLFRMGSRFQGLDYRVLTGLLYDYDAILDAHGINGKVKLAADVVVFPPERRALYKAVKVDAEGRNAVYLFEPAMMEVVTDEVVYGGSGADGEAAVAGSARKSELKPTTLDVDEFIADMWMKGVRFGIEAAAVAEVIARGETARMEVACQLDATEGSDAEIEEVSDALRRDNSPKKLANGKADLRRYQNRFPQIAAGVRLLRKKPRVLGKPGFRVNGAAIEPPVPEDFDLNVLAGVGTQVVRQEGYEFIMASMDGFLSLDVATNHIEITEKIENKGGISSKTTGDLSLAGDEFIEHGEVQEGRVVEGKNMTFRSDVYGVIVSHGGFILLEKNLSSGSARSEGGGDVTSNGLALNSIIEAWDGRVTVKYAEGCLVSGQTVVVERAVNCEIVAETVQIDSAEGCGIAGRHVRIRSSTSCRGKETIVSMLVPDVSVKDAQIRQVHKAIVDCTHLIEAKGQELLRLKADEEFAKYLSLANSIRQGSIKLSAAQQESWQKMSARFAKTEQVVETPIAVQNAQQDRIQAFEQEAAYLLAEREKSGEGIRLEITAITGDTLVRTMFAGNGIAGFRNSTAGELRIRLREQGLPQERVFFNDEGALEWHFELPELAEPIPQ